MTVARDDARETLCGGLTILFSIFTVWSNLNGQGTSGGFTGRYGNKGRSHHGHGAPIPARGRQIRLHRRAADPGRRRHQVTTRQAHALANVGRGRRMRVTAMGSVRGMTRSSTFGWCPGGTTGLSPKSRSAWQHAIPRDARVPRTKGRWCPFARSWRDRSAGEGLGGFFVLARQAVRVPGAIGDVMDNRLFREAGIFFHFKVK